MKKVILLAFILTSSILFAQENKRDVIYLKNGSIIKGEIIEQVPGKSMTIQTLGGSTFVYSVNDIIKVKKENFENKKSNKNKSNRFNYYSFNLGVAINPKAGVGFNLNLVDLNIAAKNGFGGSFKWGSHAFSEQEAALGIGYLLVGPSYSISSPNYAGIGTIKLLVGAARPAAVIVESNYGGTKIAQGEFGFAFGIGTASRFFTKNRWNFLIGSDLIFIKDYFAVDINVGFAYSW